jgi:hypothetical protein
VATSLAEEAINHMRDLTRAFVAGVALISAAFAAGPVKANSVGLLESGVLQGILTDGGASVTFLGYVAPLTLDNVAPYTAITTTVSPADPGTLVPIANSFFGTSFTVSDDHRTNTGGPAVDISTQFFSLTIGMQQTAFFQNLSGGTLHLSYTARPGVGGGLSHYDQYGTPVPGPIVGAGLPGLIAACCGLLGLARRRRKPS